MTDEIPTEGGVAASEARSHLLAAASGHILARAIHVAVQLKFADALAEFPKTARELAADTATNEQALYRLMHFLARHGFFTETNERRFAPTAYGNMLRSDAPANTAAVVQSLGSPAVWNAFGSLSEVIRTGQPPLERRDGQLYQREGNLPHESLLSKAMVGYHAGEPEAVATTYPFGKSTRLVDVGGSSGSLTGAILLHHPRLHGTVYDRPGIEAEARAHLDGLGLAGRFDFVGGDFFRSVPKGADLYILSHIVHDWGDGDALRILGACRRAMGSGSKLLILEALMSPDGLGEAEIPADLLLLANAEGRLRTLEEHNLLLQSTGLRFVAAMPCGPKVSLIEAEVA